jgi:hypothetical protein
LNISPRKKRETTRNNTKACALLINLNLRIPDPLQARGSPSPRQRGSDRADNVKDRASGRGCALPGLDHACVVGPVDDAVDAIGGQRGQSVLVRRPAGKTSTAGRQDDQRLVGEVMTTPKSLSSASTSSSTGSNIC